MAPLPLKLPTDNEPLSQEIFTAAGEHVYGKRSVIVAAISNRQHDNAHPIGPPRSGVKGLLNPTSRWVLSFEPNKVFPVVGAPRVGILFPTDGQVGTSDDPPGNPS